MSSRYFLQQTRLFLNNKTFQSLLNYTATRRFPLFPPKKKEDEESPGVKIKELVRIKEFFDEEGLKSNFDSKHYVNTLENFKTLRKVKRFGYAEFVSAALPAMKEFGVEKDLESYKALMKVFPKGAFIPVSKFAAGLYPYIVQQQAACKIMLQMEENKIMPDREFEQIIVDAFSRYSLVWQKCARMTYWMTKFKNANPFPFPEKMSKDPLELAIVALRRMTIYVDPQTEVYVYRTNQIDENADDTWICFTQSDTQCKLIENLEIEKYKVSVDGPFNVWVLDNPISYYVLIARENLPKENLDLVEEMLNAQHDNNDVSDIPLSNFGNLDLKEAIDPMRQKHQQVDGTILSIVATGTSSQQSLLLWLSKLEQHNPRLRSIPIIVAPSNQSEQSSKSEDFKKEYSFQLHKKSNENVQKSETFNENQTEEKSSKDPERQ